MMKCAKSINAAFVGGSEDTFIHNLLRDTAGFPSREDVHLVKGRGRCDKAAITDWESFRSGKHQFAHITVSFDEQRRLESGQSARYDSERGEWLDGADNDKGTGFNGPLLVVTGWTITEVHGGIA